MTIKDCIDIVENIKPNQYSIKDKVMWLSFIEEIIINEVLKTHEGYDGRYDLFEGYSEDKLSVTLIVPPPYDRLYPEYLKMMIDKENGEVARYNNSMVSYNAYMTEFRKHYNKTHMPLDATRRRPNIQPPRKGTSGLSDAEYENLKKDLAYILTEYFSETISEDKLYDIVTKFARNNVAMLKGKDGRDGVDGKDGYTPQKNIDYFDGAKGPKGNDGYTPKKGTDYFTEAEINAMKDSLAETLKTLFAPSYAYIELRGGADNWTQEAVTDSSGNVVGNRYGQIVNVNNAVITEHSKVDLQIDSEQMVVFYEKDLAFVTENEEEVVTVYCVGNVPENDYTIRAVITEVV
jgi:hypothetical protein